MPTVVCPGEGLTSLRGSHIAAHRLPVLLSSAIARQFPNSHLPRPGLTDPSHRASPGNANTPTSSPGVRYSSSTCGGVEAERPGKRQGDDCGDDGNDEQRGGAERLGRERGAARRRGDCFQVTLIGTGGLIPRPIAEECNVCPTTHCSPSTRCICTGRSRGAGCDTGSLARRIPPRGGAMVWPASAERLRSEATTKDWEGLGRRTGVVLPMRRYTRQSGRSRRSCRFAVVLSAPSAVD